ncbi:hypothetical protein NDU88_002584 [Pleurodeles waltl]|uniref:Uncharacterized protein n=1 Tax=Pleurodeles waltl TaxID=8319 RepID=A0AAV7UW14_PLEWA|nr:hypothetical protein NDU88_002584 [Pleurodeles waltl]
MGKSKMAKAPSGARDALDAPTKEQDTTVQALRQMELTLRNHTSQFEKVLQAIVETKTTLESKIGEVVADVGLSRRWRKTWLD